MTTAEFEPLTVAVPLREEPPGVFRVGNSRVLLDLVIRAFQDGATPEGVVASFRHGLPFRMFQSAMHAMIALPTDR
ncbi:MAG: hypothetical protein U0746_16855 [Gemmataceae bacterium]